MLCDIESFFRTGGSFTQRYVERHGLADGIPVYDRCHLIRRGWVFCRLDVPQAASDRRPEAQFQAVMPVLLNEQSLPDSIGHRLAKLTPKQGRQTGAPNLG